MYLEALKIDEEVMSILVTFYVQLNFTPWFLFRKALYFNNLGVLYHRWHHYDNAAESYKKALVLDPKNKSAATNLKAIRDIMKTSQEWLRF